MREAKRQQLRDAYHGKLTRAQIARRHAISEATLFRFWAVEKDEGRLPAERPHFPKSAPVIPDDDSPIADPNPTFEKQCAAALDALREHHATTPQVAPAHWLRTRAELATFKMTVEEIDALVPAHRELMAMCRAYDNERIVQRHLETVPA